MNRVRVRKVRAESRDEHQLLQQEDFTWLAELREAVSPYWAARMVYRPARAQALTIRGLQAKGR